MGGANRGRVGFVTFVSCDLKTGIVPEFYILHDDDVDDDGGDGDDDVVDGNEFHLIFTTYLCCKS